MRNRCSRRRLSRNRRQGFQLEHLEERRVLDSTVVFNEIMYNPAGPNDAQQEWIEFYNQLVVDIDISEWVLTGGVDYQFPDETVVPGKGYLLLAADPQAFEAETGRKALGPWTGQLSNGGEALQLYNNDNRVLNEVEYNDNGDWPTAPDGTGVTLAKARQQTNSEVPETWTFSEQLGGTPGGPNFLEPGLVSTTELIVSPSPMRAIVPSDDSLQTTWTELNFDDSSWLVGTGGAGFDSRSTYDPFLGLDFDAPPNGQNPSPMVNVNSSAYMRVAFDAPADLAEMDALRLRMRYDDGFVAYLNGTEVASANAPGRDGEAGTLAWDSTSTRSHRDSEAVLFDNFDIADLDGLLQPGLNVLAIQGLNRSLTDSDALWDVELLGITNLEPPPNTPLLINEFAAAGDANFFVELKNDGDLPIDLAGMYLLSNNTAVPRYNLPSQSLAAGDRFVVTAQQLGQASEDNDLFLLLNAEDRVLDGARVDDRGRARSVERGQRWMNAAQATPGAENVLGLTDDIVINEIMYHPSPVLGIPNTPPTFDRTAVIPFTYDQWRYNATGASLAADWATQSYPVDGADWQLGQGLIGFESSDLGIPINTQLTKPSGNDPRFTTYYFQTDFELTAEQLSSTDVVSISHMIDDGAVFYLNGQEVIRFKLPDGPIDSTTPASQSTTNATRVGPIELPLELLKEGTNTLSAEVHLRTQSSSDIVFGAELTVGTEVAPFVPGSPYRERSEMEWIELYNKGDAAIDLSGWEMDRAVDYDFPQGTILGAKQYLVVAKDATAFSAVYPGVRVVGDYDGSLSDHDELIRLWDRNDNLADEVHYYEGNGDWPDTPDGGGSSLELIDADADNNRATAWAASDESGKAEWVSQTFQGISLRDVYNNRPLFNEFIFGLLDSGEFLIDDVQVIKDPNGANRDMIQNGTFEADTIGEAPDKWRLIGNHSGVVITDPTDPNNKVLRVTSTGAQAFVHDHAETTFVNDEDISDGTEYQLSFRAKWLSGNGQLNSRLWFNRLGNTVRLDVPTRVGTPGAVNGSVVDNAGPTFDEFGHSPVNPAETESVTVSVRPQDADGVASATLYWREDGQDWNTAAMVADSSGLYQSEIPPHSAGTIVQFYVEAVDGQGATTMYPADGPASRALYIVEDGAGPSSPIERYRLVLMQDEQNDLYRQTNVMSNWYLPMTLIHENTAYYNVKVRLIGSRWIRPNSGYKVVLRPEQSFNGVHDSLRFDMNGLPEIVMKQMLNRSGGHQASNYDDLVYLVSPRRGHTHEVILQLARYDNVFLKEQFVNGGDGTKWELDDVTVATNPIGGVEGLKTATDVYTSADFGVNSSIAAQQGDNPEFYRGHLLIKSNRAKDDFQAIADFTQAIHKEGKALFDATNKVMDVDLWMRHYANQSYFGNWDTYGFRRPKNLRIYQRPEDDRIIPLFWDCDLCNFTEPIKTRREATSRLDEIRDIPHNLRLYWGHMLDYINTSFTEEYVAKWAAHYGSLVNNQTFGGDETFSGIARSTATRSRRALADLEKDIPRVDFEITTNGGEDVDVTEPTILLEGKGWVDIRYVRLAGTQQSLDVFWPTKDGWQVELPISTSPQTFTFEAVGFRGDLIATDSVTVTTTSVDPIMESLRISEVQYNPADPSASELLAGFGDNDDFEYIELTNIGGQSIALSGVEFVRTGAGNDEQGVEFVFATGDVTQLDPGQTVVVVEDVAAFRARYGQGPTVAGQWAGRLSNSSEQITLISQGVIIQQFTYQDDWESLTDGTGRSLQAADVASPDLSLWNTAAGWRPSSLSFGSPGVTEALPGDANGDGIFNSADLIAVLEAGEYEDAIAGNSTFEEGDFNDDSDFTSDDLVWVFQFGLYSEEANRGLASRPINSDFAQVSRGASKVTAEPRRYEDETRPRESGVTVRRRHLDRQHVDTLFGEMSVSERGGLSEGDRDDVSSLLNRVLDDELDDEHWIRP